MSDANDDANDDVSDYEGPLRAWIAKNCGLLEAGSVDDVVEVLAKGKVTVPILQEMSKKDFREAGIELGPAVALNTAVQGVSEGRELRDCEARGFSRGLVGAEEVPSSLVGGARARGPVSQLCFSIPDCTPSKQPNGRSPLELVDRNSPTPPNWLSCSFRPLARVCFGLPSIWFDPRGPPFVLFLFCLF
jgi:hypothetical protein